MLLRRVCGNDVVHDASKGARRAAGGIEATSEAVGGRAAVCVRESSDRAAAAAAAAASAEERRQKQACWTHAPVGDGAAASAGVGR